MATTPKAPKYRAGDDIVFRSLGDRDVMLTGTVWSQGPTASSRWVLMDDGSVFRVAVPTPAKVKRGETVPVQASDDVSIYFRHIVKVLDNLVAHGTLYAKTDPYLSGWRRGNRQPSWMWHAWPECPVAAMRDSCDIPADDPALLHLATRHSAFPDALAIRDNPFSHDAARNACRVCVWLEAPREFELNG